MPGALPGDEKTKVGKTVLDDKEIYRYKSKYDVLNLNKDRLVLSLLWFLRCAIKIILVPFTLPVVQSDNSLKSEAQ